jgi:hypothetical protein
MRIRDIDAEYEEAAEFVANRYGNGLVVNGVPFVQALVDISPEVLEFILFDPVKWEDRVNDYCYSISMEGKTK